MFMPMSFEQYLDKYYRDVTMGKQKPLKMSYLRTCYKEYLE